MNLILASEKDWHLPLFENLKKQFPQHAWHLINKKEDLNADNLSKLIPGKIFFPHWSYIIPSGIYENYECIVFHMTDLPFGRGGSPLQNLILRGHTKTKLSALKVEGGIDSGPIYLKKDLDLGGSARDIFIRSSFIIGEMIIEIIQMDLKPEPQQGEVVEFKRRNPKESNIAAIQNIDELYNYIRMLDAEGYPNAFVQTEAFHIEFYNASLEEDKTIIANVRIIKK